MEQELCMVVTGIFGIFSIRTHQTNEFHHINVRCRRRDDGGKIYDFIFYPRNFRTFGGNGSERR